MKTLEFYHGRDKEIRWRLIARNGRVVADSGESYKKILGAKRGANSALAYKIRPDIRVKYALDVVAQ